ncbi:MAG: hypothetical protein A3C56_02080 [Ignavibacteria bacterium RIFCSPHIGHO2_02_FULL_56_12]|nr:MAG: hypothetical protein A3C56_02080 [Ignavibacteria bacterium RIFCSPHIGHO2_02_FULL_56_12]
MEPPPFLFQRSTRVSLLILTLQSLVFTRIPLLNYLGFEFSAATAPLLTLLTGLAVIRIVSESKSAPDNSFAQSAKYFLKASIFVVPPFVIAAANAMIVRNCSFPEGLLYYIVVVLPALAFAVGLALLSLSASRSFPRTLFVLLWTAVLLHVPVVTFAGAQIFAFNPIIGAFPGLTYDETLTILPKLALYRISTLVTTALLISAAHVIEERRRRPGLRLLRSRKALAVGIWTLAVSAVLWQSERLGFSSSLNHIRETLGGVRETEHFTVLYPRQALTDAQADRLASLHEFYYERICKTLRVAPAGRITSSFYESPEQKSTLVGGGRTDFAKPWLWQLHLNLGSASQSLKHELTHVLAAEFGFPLVRIGMNSGLIEGLAVAVERESNGETLHRAAAQIVAAGIQPNLENVFSTFGFFRSHSAVSYTLAGSFCRYLIEEYGVSRFKVLYGSGSFLEAYRRPLQSLLPDWERRFRSVKLSQSDTIKALYFYDRPPIFTRECLRTIGNLNADARMALVDRRYEDARALAERSLSLARSTEAVFLQVQSLNRLGQYALALAAIDSARRDERMKSALVTLDLYAGDAWWALGDIARARSAYGSLLTYDLSAAWNEAAALRLTVISHFGRDIHVRNAFLLPAADSIRRSVFDSLLQRRPDDIFRYVRAQLSQKAEESERAVELLRDLRVFPYDVLNYQARRRLATAHIVLGEYERAKGALWESLNFTTHEVEIMKVEEGIERCVWLQRHKQANERF